MGKWMFVWLLKVDRLLGNRGLGSLPGVRTAKQLLLRWSTPSRRVLFNTGKVRLYLDAGDSGVARELLASGTYEPFELELFRAAVSRGMVILDVGANIGYYCLNAAEKSGDGARIYAFEPEPSTLALLRKNIELNEFQSITPVNAALADKAGVLTLNVDKDNQGKHSLLDAGSSGQPIEISATTIDEFTSQQQLDRLDLIKLDVEGAEGLVLAGAYQTLRNFRPTIFVEYTPDWLEKAGTDVRRLFETLVALGYRARLIDARAHCLRDVDFEELEHLRRSTTWTFQANLVLEVPGAAPASAR